MKFSSSNKKKKHNKSLNHRKQKHKKFWSEASKFFSTSKSTRTTTNTLKERRRDRNKLFSLTSASNDGDESSTVLSKFENIFRVKRFSFLYPSFSFSLQKLRNLHCVYSDTLKNIVHNSIRRHRQVSARLFVCEVFINFYCYNQPVHRPIFLSETIFS